MFELGVAIGVRRALARFLERVQAIAEPVQELPDRRRAHGPAVRGQRPGQLRGALARPSQGRHRVAARQRLDQQVQGLGHPRLRLLGVRTPRPGLANAVGRRHALRQLSTPVPNRLPRQPRRRRDDRVAPEADRDRFGGGLQPLRSLIEQRAHHHILGHERCFQVRIAPHRTAVGSRFPVTWQANSRVKP